MQEILATLKEARELNSNHYSVWHAWAVANYDQLKRVDNSRDKDSKDKEKAIILPQIQQQLNPMIFANNGNN